MKANNRTWTKTKTTQNPAGRLAARRKVNAETIGGRVINWLVSIFIFSRLLLPVQSLAAFNALPPLQQVGVTIDDRGAQYVFGQQVTFQALITSGRPIQSVVIFVTPAGQSTIWHTALLSDQNTINEVIPVSQLALRPFAQVTYRYQVNLANGNSFSSNEFSFQYDDNRFSWQKVESPEFQVSWYGRDPAFGQQVLNIAEAGLRNARSILDVPPPARLKIYVYLSSRDLQSALNLENQPWVAGHASPDLDQVMISIPSGPEQKLELERQVPHEIMHILQYRVMGEDFTQQPVWLLEGMASIAELYPNPEYQYVLTTAAKQELLSFNTLCSSFPREASGAYLAYAQSESFTRYLHQKFGSSGLLNLITQYQDGQGCEEGMATALGLGLGQMEYRWKQEALGINAAGLVLRNLAPYLLVLLLLVVPALLALLPPVFKKTAREVQAS
jgi:hypothetical protein